MEKAYNVVVTLGGARPGDCCLDLRGRGSPRGAPALAVPTARRPESNPWCEHENETVETEREREIFYVQHEDTFPG